MPRWTLGLASACLLASGSPGAAEEAPPAAEVARAIETGRAWLTQRIQGAWRDEKVHDLAEIVVLTLGHCGANLKDKTYAEGVELLTVVEPRWTYRAALQAMALAQVNEKLHQRKIAHCAQWLVDTQLAAGEWGYPGATEGDPAFPEGVKVPAPGIPASVKVGERIQLERRGTTTAERPLKGDFSNTQVAILGLRAARDANVHAPKETWQAALKYLRDTQREDGGWGYVMQGEQDMSSYASLTAAGLCSTAVCLEALGPRDVKGDAGVRKALAWLSKRLDVARNVGIDQSSVVGPSPWRYYHLYALERAGRVLGVEKIGAHAWYDEGARWLLGAQRSDGSWADGDGAGTRPAYFTPADTCFALLFLTRATRPVTGR
jgi:hypothetical protein